MVIERNYQRVLDTFIERNGNKPVDFFAVLRMDELIDKWSVLLAARWVTEENRKEAFNSLVSILLEALSSEEVAEVARVGIMPTSSHLIELFLEKCHAGQYIKEDARINGNVIHEGHIIKCSASHSTPMES